MSNPIPPKELSTLSDERLRELFRRTLEEPGRIDLPFADEWRAWLVSLLCQHLAGQQWQTLTDRCRYVAFALRYLAAVDSGTGEPIKVRLVMTVMESRPGVVAGLLFGSVEERQRVLRAAFDPSTNWGTLPDDPFQRTVIEEYVKRFSERKPVDGNPAYDESTIARWSRDLIPELEKLVLDQVKPARQVAQDAVIQKMVTGPRPEVRGSDRAMLAAYLEQCEHDPLSAHYGIALSALNDYDRRAENEERQFRSQRKAVGMMLLSMAILVGALLLSLGDHLPDLLRALALLFALCSAVGAAMTLMYLFVRIVVATVTLTEHITRTRMDIQTLQQLIRAATSDQI